SARARAAVAAGVAALVVAACTTPGPASEPTDAASAGRGPAGPSTASDPAGPSSPSDSPGPSTTRSPAAGPGQDARPDDRGTADPVTEPLAIAVHHTSPLREVSLPRARRIVAGASDLDVVAGPPRAAVREVARDPGAVAVVPARVLGPELRAVSVAGVDPVRRPGAYPLRTGADEEPGPVVSVTVVGDIMLGRGVAEAARGSDHPAPALMPTAARISRADVAVGNLENTLSRAGPPTQGGDSFAADPAVSGALREAGFDVLGLANNHAGDFGDRALVRTVRRLRAAGLETFGAGATPRRAWAPAVVERQGVRFGFLGFNAIGETPTVAPGQPGAVSVGMPPRTGPLDRAALSRFERAVRRLDRRVDVVVVLPHWGTQYTNRPEPVQRTVARRLVRAGADVVVGGHPHWLQGVELVRGRLVVHSLGNFVFDMDFMRETQEGAILEMTFWGGELKAADFVPYVMDERYAPRVVAGVRGAEVLEVMRATSGPAHRSRR
ncbi:MAG TPA: CapA family protein, partial [Nocardioidaceae bacterium]